MGLGRTQLTRIPLMAMATQPTVTPTRTRIRTPIHTQLPCIRTLTATMVAYTVDIAAMAGTVTADTTAAHADRTVESVAAVADSVAVEAVAPEAAGNNSLLTRANLCAWVSGLHLSLSQS